MILLRRLPFSLNHTRSFTVLAFESSADDTCAAVVHSSKSILSNVVIKQNNLHEQYGGIYPITAIDAHQRNMPYAVRRALKEANVDLVKDINGIAFTRGPGMPGCLSVGMNAAKTLAAALNKPIVGVHHMQGHALTPLLTSSNPPKFPFLSLLVSGGHTLLLLATSLDSFQILATTVDESIGRAIDQVSKLLDLKWTSLGPGDALEKFCAQKVDTDSIVIPLPRVTMAGKLSFSYSGLHSRVERYIETLGGINNIDLPTRMAIARAFQKSAMAQLEDKLLLGLQWCQQKDIPVRHVVLSGGVASNQYLRERLHQCILKADLALSIDLVFPPPPLCTDNAVMIGWASMHRFLANDFDEYDIESRPKWSIDQLASSATRRTP
ncbi:uncharacterized protein LACBIDRAFT_313559 [Laccaria bicolor S238N-H82]|uniref:N(6)-L-threonylcarbamoyladenine synthase n=1 Tax=Laccaria bicolor (strain S238N-H82 / ATCC MYA-4686) TaxID=486041 RepID=B0D096_LACBS|nr:uncharacterized protein LACBIDRAFT_313559 [Laccaria bicolor S238N-H82]EDR11791.1 predicted protein [Laccaria bicolor S238N-H82]|eukprot:XP_001877688.1 predicted protein [Laccaria bicolor S238N-H82]